MGSPIYEPILTYGIYTCIFVSQGWPKVQQCLWTLENEDQVEQNWTNNNRGNPPPHRQSFPTLPHSRVTWRGTWQISFSSVVQSSSSVVGVLFLFDWLIQKIIHPSWFKKKNTQTFSTITSRTDTLDNRITKSSVKGKKIHQSRSQPHKNTHTHTFTMGRGGEVVTVWVWVSVVLVTFLMTETWNFCLIHLSLGDDTQTLRQVHTHRDTNTHTSKNSQKNSDTLTLSHSLKNSHPLPY
jgi:hypothetical protein